MPRPWDPKRLNLARRSSYSLLFSLFMTCTAVEPYGKNQTNAAVRLQYVAFLGERRKLEKTVYRIGAATPRTSTNHKQGT